MIANKLDPLAWMTLKPSSLRVTLGVMQMHANLDHFLATVTANANSDTLTDIVGSLHASRAHQLTRSTNLSIVD